MLFKNVASQKIHVYAYDSTTGAAKTGDAANITAYVSLDGTANAIDDTNPAEVDATNMPGVYVFDLAQAETNCNSFALYAKSATSNIRIEPIIGFTTGAANSLSVNTGTITNDAITAAAIANGAIDAATFAADVDAEILSYIVDDATRIDASSLNTATVTSIPAILDDTGTAGVVVAAGSKTGYTLTATTGLGNQTANITGNLSGSVGSVTGAVGSVTAGVTVTTNNDKSGYSLTAGTGLGNQTANITGTVSGNSTHSAADVVTALGTGSTLTALATAANLAAAKAILDKFNTMVVLDGAVYDFTSDALAAAPGGTGSDPLSSAVPGAYAAGTAGYVIGTYLDAAISGVGGAVGSGADSVTVTWTSEGNPVADGDVWVATDAAGTNVVAGTLQTDSNGQATFQLDAGSVYFLFGQRDGINSIRGERFVAVAD